MSAEHWLTFLGTIVVAAPAALLALLGVTLLFSAPLSERVIARATQTAIFAGLLGAVAILGLMLSTGARSVPVEFGHWVVLPAEDFHFHFKFVFDRLSVPFTILTFVLTGTIGGFANVYLHREPGYRRYFLLYAVFLLGMVVSSLAGTIETLFFGWELVGLSSALLVAYFQERPAPVRNGLHVWSVYRIADAAFLMAAIALHHVAGAGEFTKMMGSGLWPEGQASLTSMQAFGVGLLLLVAAAGKSAMIPFSGWLPRAMEGPTPSSAVFYGSLSVHLGAYLLLRVSPILEQSPVLCGLIVALGVTTALFAAVTGRVQTDVKSSLAYASLTQVGIIVAEIGLGLRYLPLMHIIGHACLRTLQLLRAPTLLRDYHSWENALGGELSTTSASFPRGLPAGWRVRLYRFAFERGGLDELLSEVVVQPVLRVFRWCDVLEHRWTDFLAGRPSRESDHAGHAPDRVEEML